MADQFANSIVWTSRWGHFLSSFNSFVVYYNISKYERGSKGYISQKYSIYLHFVYIYNAIFDIVKQQRT